MPTNLEVQIEGLLDTKTMNVSKELNMAQRFNLYGHYFGDILAFNGKYTMERKTGNVWRERGMTRNKGPWERDTTRRQTRERQYILGVSTG